MKNINRMNLAITFIYNEIEMLPKAVQYYQKQGLEVYVIDNYSTDGSWEWLQTNNIPSHRVDTNNSFHLDKLQAEMLETIHKLKPDWVVWFSPDLYHVFLDSITAVLSDANRLGCTYIQSHVYNVRNTGENRDNGHFTDVFLYAHYNTNPIRLICKYHSKLTLTGDAFTIPNLIQYRGGFVFEYGMTKPAHKQIEKLERREKAWKEGLNRDYGHHYTDAKEIDFIYDKMDLVDISWGVADIYLKKLREELQND